MSEKSIHLRSTPDIWCFRHYLQIRGQKLLLTPHWNEWNWETPNHWVYSFIVFLRQNNLDTCVNNTFHRQENENNSIPRILQKMQQKCFLKHLAVHRVKYLRTTYQKYIFLHHITLFWWMVNLDFLVLIKIFLLWLRINIESHISISP